MKKEPNVFLQHILENISRIESFSEGLTKEKLEKDDRTQYAIIRAIEIIGEAIKNLPQELTEKHPEIPWKDIAGTRDKIIHQYFDIDLDTVWDTLQKDIPDLKNKIQKLIKNSQ